MKKICVCVEGGSVCVEAEDEWEEIQCGEFGGERGHRERCGKEEGGRVSVKWRFGFVWRRGTERSGWC